MIDVCRLTRPIVWRHAVAYRSSRSLSCTSPRISAISSFQSHYGAVSGYCHRFSKISASSSTMSRGVATPVATSKAPQKHRAFIALGSNLGERVGMIEEACRRMSERGIRVVKTSGLWESEPMYVLDQGRFVNGVCEVRRAFL